MSKHPAPNDLKAHEAWGVLRVKNERGAVNHESGARLDLHSGKLVLEDPISRTAFDFGYDTFTFRLKGSAQALEVEEWVGLGDARDHFCLDADLELAREQWQGLLDRRLGPASTRRTTSPRF